MTDLTISIHSGPIQTNFIDSLCSDHHHPRKCFQFQVDFKKSVQVTAIATQGRNSRGWPQWVTSFEIQYSNNGHYWKSYKRGGVTKVSALYDFNVFWF